MDKVTGVAEPMVEETKIDGGINNLFISGGKLFAGGSIEGISGVARVNECIAFGAEGNILPWNPEFPEPPQGEVLYNIVLHHVNDLVYYRYKQSDGAYILGVVDDINGAVIPGWAVTVNNDVYAWAFSDDVIYLAGEFTEVNGTPRNGVAAVDLETGDLLSWTIPLEISYSDGEQISAMIYRDNTLYISGTYSFVLDSEERMNLSAWNATTGDLLPWSPVVALGEYDEVVLGTIDDTFMYLIGSVAMRVDLATGVWDESWLPDLASDYVSVRSVSLSGNSVFLGGSFSPGLVRVDKITGQITGWQPSMYDVYESEGTVFSVATTETMLYAGGNFAYEVSGEYRSDFAVYLWEDSPPNHPPVITPEPVTLKTGGTVTVNLVSMITDEDDNLDLSTLTIVVIPESNASATIDGNFNLILDYTGIIFSGTDQITLSVCDTEGSCTQQQFEIEVEPGVVIVYNALSPNCDGLNDSFVLLYIDELPETQSNHVWIFNRWGDVVFEIENYNNQDRVFKGLNSSGKALPSGTYFYRIRYTSGIPKQEGYLVLKR